MTDQELLEQAAKAAGLPVEMSCEGGIGWFACGRDQDGGVIDWWNPLKDSGHALDLAVRLKLWVQISDRSVFIAQNADEILGEMAASTMIMFADFGGDPHAATRRAIVRAAASLADSRGDSQGGAA